jgi:hypothetical protein
VTSKVLDLSTVIDLVLGLEIDENSRISVTVEEAIEDRLELSVSKYFKCIIFANCKDISDN